MLMEFVGHGAWGVITKAAWVPYFGVFGVSERTAYQLMPVVGTMDITLGVIGFMTPRRWALAYGAFWGLFTALLRPAAGESWWEVLDRGGNILGPFTFLMLSGFPRAARDWWEPIQWKPVTREQLRGIARSLKILTVSILIGHGAYGALLQKQDLQDQYMNLGLTGLPMIGTGFISVLGWIEIALGLAILFRPLRAFALAACLFKIVTESFYPLAGTRVQWWEWVERGFTYLGPLALFFVLPHVKEEKPAREEGT